MKDIFASNSFQKDFKLARKRGKSIAKIQSIFDLLQNELPLPLRCRPYKLVGQYAGMWECHIEPDWLLIYDITETEIRLYRTGTHSDLFG